ncbi:MAG TPA: ion transporter [Croceibacterium sp.]|jgi:voltage-gated potassium channel
MASNHRRWKTLCQLEAWLDPLMLWLSIAWLVVVVVQLLDPHSNPVLEAIATVLWIVFIVDFVVRFSLAPGKRTFLKRNWLVLIALLVPALRIFRIFAVFRAAGALRGIQLVRIVGTANRGMNALRHSLARRQFGYVGGMTLLVVTLGAAGMLYLEPAKEVGGGFKSYADALWWTVMLLTTIGSQYWPQTSEGRILAVLMSIYGLAVFGYITAVLASFFIGRDAEEPEAPIVGVDDIGELRDEIAALRAALEAKGAISAPRNGPRRNASAGTSQVRRDRDRPSVPPKAAPSS